MSDIQTQLKLFIYFILFKKKMVFFINIFINYPKFVREFSNYDLKLKFFFNNR